MSNLPGELPRWATDGSAGNPATGGAVVDPNGAKKTSGWLVNEMPPFSYLNWFFYTVYLWCFYLQNLTSELLTWLVLFTFRRIVSLREGGKFVPSAEVGKAHFRPSFDVSSVTPTWDTLFQVDGVGGGGTAVTLRTLADAGAGAGSVAVVGNAITVHYKSGVSRVLDLEALFPVTTTFGVVSVKAFGANPLLVLSDPANTFAATAFVILDPGPLGLVAPSSGPSDGDFYYDSGRNALRVAHVAIPNQNVYRRWSEVPRKVGLTYRQTWLSSFYAVTGGTQGTVPEGWMVSVNSDNAARIVRTLIPFVDTEGGNAVSVAGVLIQPGNANAKDAFVVTAGLGTATGIVNNTGALFTTNPFLSQMKMRLEWTARLSVFGAGDLTGWWMGCSDATAANSPTSAKVFNLGVAGGKWFGFRKSASSADWNCVSQDAGGEVSALAVTPTANYEKHRFRIDMTLAGGLTTIQFYVDDVLKFTTDNIGTHVPSAAMRLGFGGLRTGVATSYLVVDPLELTCDTDDITIGG